MSKSKKMSVETGRGTVNHNALAALVTSRIFRPQVVSAKKGKGSYKRNGKHKLKAYSVAFLVEKLANSLLANCLGVPRWFLK